MSDSNVVKVLKTLKKFEILTLVALFIENSKIEKVELGKLQNSCELILRDLQDKEKQDTNFFKKNLFQDEKLEKENINMKVDENVED